MRLKDQVAIITGAGSGFGRASSLLFAAQGAHVVAVDLVGERVQETVTLIRREGGSAAAVTADVGTAAGAQAMVGAALEGWGQVDILFNNAGVVHTKAAFEELDEETWDRVMNVNVKASFLACRAALPHMKARRRGVILITASTAGLRPRPHMGAYATSKAAAIGLVKALALEVGPFGIRANALCPVASPTPMLHSLFPPGADPEQAQRAYSETIPLGRLCQPEDVANAALYLASPEAGFITGVALEVDGGRCV